MRIRLLSFDALERREVPAEIIPGLIDTTVLPATPSDNGPTTARPPETPPSLPPGDYTPPTTPVV